MRDTIKKLEELNIEKQEVKEDLADMAQEAEKDHEVQMARSDLYKAAKYSVAIHKMMKDVSEMQGIEGWVASKITKAADYLGSVKHYMEGEMMADVELAVVPVAGDMTDAMDVPQEDIEEVHEGKVEEDAMGDMKLQNLINKISGANKPMKKQPTQTDMIDKIIKNLPRDKEEMGIDAMPMPQKTAPKAPKVPMQQKQKMVNKMARDPYGADTTASFGTMKNWGKK